jgi:hypothetical protein
LAGVVGNSFALPSLAVDGDATADSALEPAPGKVVEFQLASLSGNPDDTGTVKIQLYPEWAPKGVARFEVRTEQLHTGVLYYRI